MKFKKLKEGAPISVPAIKEMVSESAQLTQTLFDQQKAMRAMMPKPT